MRRARLLLAACLALGAAGCGSRQDYGFAEILLGYGQVGADVYALGGDTVSALRRKATALVRQRVGRAELVLQRNGQSWTLCNVDIRKNRIAKVSVVSMANVLRCELR